MLPSHVPKPPTTYRPIFACVSSFPYAKKTCSFFPVLTHDSDREKRNGRPEGPPAVGSRLTVRPVTRSAWRAVAKGGVGGTACNRDRVALARVAGGGSSTGPPAPGSRDRRCLARVRGLAHHRRGVPGHRGGARRLRQPPPWAAWPAAACGGSDTAGLGARLPLVRSGAAGSDRPGQLVPCLARPERGAGGEQRQRAAARPTESFERAGVGRAGAGPGGSQGPPHWPLGA